ncbi:MAG: hypothetical protein COV60_02050 [Candidatus Magasanikbacteria bacterium CG11_big_fil_rev_8_21_14_0_20_43_7]|uniref:Uncharacterized protein n=1 Tax=Candidatus Magasanikbacteria bacterium CG11_big_fil_rev_8_21_14_0_20_43_7 TaxID=1974654 RepID=A0A2H0N2J3_9BACT|nr:MAG: hypothetical protein COV60_02050 [Candidatus Magasanikbacteria bacterium CG11_big_fil_rev_8_21_14_0_20_43_7]
MEKFGFGYGLEAWKRGKFVSSRFQTYSPKPLNILYQRLHKFPTEQQPDDQSNTKPAIKGGA